MGVGVGVALFQNPISKGKSHYGVVEVVLVEQLDKTTGRLEWIPVGTCFPHCGAAVDKPMLGSTTTSTTSAKEIAINKPNAWGGSRTLTTTQVPPDYHPKAGKTTKEVAE